MDHRLTTARLTLTPVADADHAALLSHWTAPEVRAFLFDDEVLTADDVAVEIADSAATFAASGYGLWIIRETADGALAGAAALRPLDELGLEVAYSLAPSVWGRGYATEAAGAVVDHALHTLGLPEVLAEVDAGNTGSIAVVERLGMTPFATVPGVLGPMRRYRRVRGG
ncbi:GNAT family N-acetyltransferase [Yinghuangia seranimata]|uniref:GNAT family N-acetyltransferase n=1 Tax=Yinghuangia seranimata TaxID=408067 RepID=UPI00248B6BCD|nr:GNAT family N-acetyltransferase [Yinghuangia seranimata]MDI2125754.1 GNAT family N-acetyltransferase [Yinghuangia seranimata]